MRPKLGVTGMISLLICEHLPAITWVGTDRGSTSAIARRTLASEGLAVRWVNRGGAALVHAPGQLAVYPDRSARPAMDSASASIWTGCSRASRRHWPR